MIYEAGVIGARPSRLPLSIGDPTLVSGAAAVCSMYDVFTLYLQRGNVDVGFLGGAQIDRFGNINATVIGDYQQPQGAPARFGRLDGDRRLGQPLLHHHPAPEAPLPRKGRFSDLSRLLLRRAAARRPACAAAGRAWWSPTWASSSPMSCTVEQVKDNTGWDIKIADTLKETLQLESSELTLLREELDPEGIYLKGS
jgi:glutaconate CoA-transferase, subunit B